MDYKELNKKALKARNEFERREKGTNIIEYITCKSGDWNVLIVNGEIYEEGHEIPDFIWLKLLSEKFNTIIVNTEISDEDMENRTFEN